MEENIICRPEDKILAENRKKMLIKLCLALAGILVLTAGEVFKLIWQEKYDFAKEVF
jgi:hypothetical protein